MATRQVLDPAGVQWRVHRRWYPWRRALSFREAWSSSPSEPAAEGEPPATSEEGLPRNVVLRVVLLVLAGLVWVVWGAAKVLFYAVVIVLFVVVSLLELALELVVMPFIVLLRLVGTARWPVEIARQGKHFATKYAQDPAGAATLRDTLAAQIEGGTPPDAPPTAA
ncbi:MULTISPECIES: hypothetical protein [unclassified Mycobacterium]|uniref:hypothetical protein n=1 Tax=unclassified Mycobacterium TaxID=2642494 RepID=UPI0029C804FE|nr:MULTISPECIES: hypothetical protein [unclassified Mycobacterium]